MMIGSIDYRTKTGAGRNQVTKYLQQHSEVTVRQLNGSGWISFQEDERYYYRTKTRAGRNILT